MSSHLHLIDRAYGVQNLSEILRDFKKFTSKAIVKSIIEVPESRREWVLPIFAQRAEELKRINEYKFWQDGNHPVEINSTAFFYSKLEYIHNNPVEDLIVEKPEDYLFSSARNYAGLDSYLEIILESHKPLFLL